MKSLHILLLAWEYPPALVGGLGRHVHELSRALSSLGHSVHVITAGVEGLPSYELEDAVHVHRVKMQQRTDEAFNVWIDSLNEAMILKADELCRNVPYDVVHAHDWLVCRAALHIQTCYHVPLATTIHATEHGRNNGIHTHLQWEIHMKERELVRASHALIVCSHFMKLEVSRVLEVKPECIAVLPNGIDPHFFQQPGCCNVRQLYGLHEQTLIFSIGRMVNEKGFYTVIEAAPHLIKKHPHAVFVIAGRGPLLERYRAITAECGLGRHVRFIGYISEAEQRAFLQQSDIILVPSLYEPFGIVALEGMLAKKPTIVTNTGGLREIVAHRQTGFIMEPGSSGSLVQQVLAVLEQPAAAAQVAERAYQHVRQHYSWLHIAEQTLAVYQGIFHSYQSGG